MKPPLAPRGYCASQRGFTLVEILIVLAIIGILAAVLLPVFNQARETARTATCSSNLKQIYLGTQLYLRDNNGTYPPPLFRIAPMCGWAACLFPYVKSEHVFECPNAENGEFRAGCPTPEGEGTEQKSWAGSYSINLLRTGDRAPTRESLIAQPSQVALFLDGGGYALQPYGPASRTSPEASFDNRYDWHLLDTRTLALSERGHNGGLNICFADGHIKRVGADDFNHRDLWLNTRDDEYKKRAP